VYSDATGHVAEFNGDVVINSLTAGIGGKATLQFSHLTSTAGATRKGATIASEAAATYTGGTNATYDADLVVSTPRDSIITETARFTFDNYLRMAVNTGGIQFNGDTADANALNDYEEGTFTATVIGATTAGTATYTAQTGTYVKIGKLVWVSLTLNWSAGTGAGDLQIVGLPFASIGGQTPGLSIGMASNLAFATNSYLFARVEPSGTKIGVYAVPSGGGVHSPVGYDPAAQLNLSGCYRTTA